MVHLIDKNALVAEIERRKQTWQHQDQQYINGGKDVCDYLLGFLDTLEVKEVDLDDLGVLASHLIACDAHGVTPKYSDRELDVLEGLANIKAQKGE